MAKMSVRRKLAIASWSAPREGNIYGRLVVNATQALAYIDYVRKKSGEKVTITHLVGRACAEALKHTPSLNGRIVWGKFVPHTTVDVAFLVSLNEGQNLAKVKIADADKKSMTDIALELGELARRLRKGEDEAFKKSMGPIKILPTWLIRPIVWISGFLTGALGLNVPALGLEAFPFGSCVVTNVGVFGLDEAFVPPTPFARVPVYVLVGALRDSAVVVDDNIVIQPQLSLTATIDHRFIDGYQGGVLAKKMREVMENPWLLEGMDGPPGD